MQFFLPRIKNYVQEPWILRHLCEKLGKPLFTPRAAARDTVPLVEDYNSMLSEIADDISFLASLAEAIAGSAQDSFNFHAAELQKLKLQLDSLVRRARESLFEPLPTPFVQAIKENFSSGNFSAASFPLARIMPYGVTLAEKTRVNASLQARVRVVPGNPYDEVSFLGDRSNGFPGNIHECTGGNFVGFADAHANYSAIIDGNPDTWFEYEAVSILPDHRPSYGRHFVWGGKRILWDREPAGGQLVLTLELAWEKPILTNCVSVVFYVPAGGRLPVLKDVRVSPDGVSPPTPVPVFSSYVAAGELVSVFAPRECKVMQLHFVQPYAYPTFVGCLHAGSADSGAVSDLALDVGEIVGGEESPYPYRTRYDARVRGVRDLLKNVLWGVEVVPAARYVIGLREVGVLEVAYEEISELVSGWYEFSSPPAYLALFADEIVPEGASVEYAVSADGVVWASVMPMGRHHNAVLRIVVDPFRESRADTTENVLVLPEPKTKFLVRAVLHGNTHATPIIRSYQLASLPGGSTPWA